jgi:hypothetical protein
MPIEPESKNWTWVIDEPCYDCGFNGPAVAIGDVGRLVRANAAEWPELLARADATLRPTGDQWSAVEYACHVRDVLRLFDYRLGLMLEHDDPHFENWDQDVTAVEQRYDLQDPAVVAAELGAAAEANAARWDTVTPDQYPRRGFRSDGAVFTVESFGRYFVHDPTHHLDDVRRGNAILDDSGLD